MASRLDHRQIVDEALAVVQTESEASLSMRSLAGRLGVTPMALYHHFADRDALLLALVERVSETIVFPEASDDPVQGSVDLAMCLHDFLVEYPWMIRLISTGRLVSPAGLRFPEGFLSLARRAGLGDDESFVFYRTMFASVLGQATITGTRQNHPSALPERAFAEPPYPIIAELESRWERLDAASTPARVFGTIAGTLPTA